MQNRNGKEKYSNIYVRFFCIFSIAILVMISKANYFYADEDTGSYDVVIQDDANLFTDEEESSLYEEMHKSNKYGNMVLITTDSNSYTSTRSLSENTYKENFDSYSNGITFVIDMDYRKIWISGFGDLQYIVTSSYCKTITDNVYKYASAGDYYSCAEKTFTQIHSLLVGKNIPRPMKYICNFLLSIIIALIINYFVAMLMSCKREATNSEIKNNMIYHCNVYNTKSEYLREKKVYDPPSGGSGGGSGGGGGGGGGCSGGGHSF